jgi:hypothetical protein
MGWTCSILIVGEGGNCGIVLDKLTKRIGEMANKIIIIVKGRRKGPISRSWFEI